MAAIELSGVVKTLRPDHGGRRARPRRARRHLPRPARAQRRRQVDDDAAADRAGDRRRRRAAGARPRAARRVQGRAGRRWASCPSSTTSTSTSPSRTTWRSSPASTGCPTSAPRSTRRSTSPACTERRRDAVDELSGGMRRRLLLARGLVHEPRLVLLDEPTVGLDPQIRTELWTLIGDLKSRGTTILMSTHYIEEAERLADEVAVMAPGQDHQPRPPGRADRRARRRARPPRSTGRRSGWPRCAPTPRPAGLWCGPPARRSRSSAPSGPATAPIPEDAVDPRRDARGRLRAADRGGGRVMEARDDGSSSRGRCAGWNRRRSPG